jgi:hypothetical protein
MSADAILAALRRFLLIITAGTFIMTVVELIFVGHWNQTIQFLPFGLCGLGLVALAVAWFRPSRVSINALRWSMIVIGVCSFIGFYEHMANNLSFWQEIQPNATTWELIVATFNGGIPVLAPGILLLGAVIGLAAIYRHPLLEAN